MKRISLTRVSVVVLLAAALLFIGGSVYLRDRSPHSGSGARRSRETLMQPDVVTFRSRTQVRLRVTNDTPWRGPTPFAQRFLILPNTGPIRDQADATVRAVQVANDAAQQQFSVAPFAKAVPKAEFDGQRWTWHRRIACGLGDLETDVTIAPNGTVEEVNVRLLVDHALAF